MKRSCILCILCIFAVLQVVFPQVVAIGQCVDVAGKWEGSENFEGTFVFDGETVPYTDSSTGTVEITQTGCDVSWLLAGYPRTGEITGSKITVSGLFMVPEEGVVFTDNLLTAEGTVDDNQDEITLKGSGFAAGTYTDEDGMQFGFATSGSATARLLRTSFMLTFDDGPYPGQTDAVVEALRHFYVNGSPVKAGFFMVGDSNILYYMPEAWIFKGSVKDHPDLVQLVANAGHLIGNHTQHHAWFEWWYWPPHSVWLHLSYLLMEDFVIDEIRQCDAEIREAIGGTPLNIFRPPYLVGDEAVVNGAGASGFKVIRGELVGDTEPFVSIEDVKNNALEKLSNWRSEGQHREPCVLIFHDIRPATYQGIGEIIQSLKEEGFHLVNFDPGPVPARRPEVKPLSGLSVERPNQGSVRLSWPSAVTDFQVEATDSLSSATDWFTITDKPMLTGDRWTLTLPTSSSQRFYRLRLRRP